MLGLLLTVRVVAKAVKAEHIAIMLVTTKVNIVFMPLVLVQFPDGLKCWFITLQMQFVDSESAIARSRYPVLKCWY